MEEQSKKWILIADENYSNRISLRNNLEQNGFGVLEVDSCANILSTVKLQQPSIVLINRDLHEGNIIEIVETLRKLEPQTKIVLTFDKEDMPYAVNAMKAGADDCLLLPINTDKSDEVLKLVDETYIKIPQSNKNNFEVLILSNVKNMIERVAPTDISVLVEGETGTEKELVTNALHILSKRNNMPIITIHGPSFSFEQLIATIKATKQTRKIPVKDTLFITLIVNDIDKMTEDQQEKFIYFLRYSDIEQIGNIDIRVIATTSNDLNELVKKENFRQELYMLVNVVTIKLLPLRLRKTELSVLAKLLINIYSKKHEKIVSIITDSALEKLQNYNWPGNIEELQNIMEAAVIMCNGNVITVESLCDKICDQNNEKNSIIKSPLKNAERELIINALSGANGNRTKAAQQLGMSRRSLYNKIKAYGLMGDL